MASLAILQAAQITARENYAAAVDTLVAAYVELNAIDRAIPAVGGQPQPSFGSGPDLPTHPVAYPNTPAGATSFGDRISDRLRQLLK